MISKAAQNPVIANLFLAFFLLMGLVCTFRMNRELFPVFSFDMINISVPYPGASPSEVEESIVSKIEESVIGLKGVKRVLSTASESFGNIVLELEEGSDPKTVRDEVISEIDRITTFPKNMEKPIISEIVREEELVFYAFSADEDKKQLLDTAEKVREELESIKGISKVIISGVQPYQVNIDISQSKLLEYQTSLHEVGQKVRSESLDISGGTLKSKNEEILVRGINEKKIAEEFAKVFIAGDDAGGRVTLKDIAHLEDGFDQNQVECKYFDKEAILLQVYRKGSADAISTYDEVKKYWQNKELPANYEVVPWFESSNHIQERIDLLVKNGWQGFLLLFFVLWFFLSFRLSVWVALGIPTSFGGALILMYLTGQSINMISLFTLIMALGIIVDDAIVVGENIFQHMKSGKPKLEAAIIGTKEVAIPVIGSVTTTIVAFMPMLLMTGVFGKFMAVIPYAMIAALLTSLFECFFILPAHLAHTKEDFKTHAVREKIDSWVDQLINGVYQKSFVIVMKFRYVFILLSVCILMITITMVQAGVVKFKIFPELDNYLLDVSFELEQGIPFQETKRVSQEITNSLKELDKELASQVEGGKTIKHITSFIGQSIGMRSKRASHVGTSVIEIVHSDFREFHSDDFVKMMREKISKIKGIKKLAFNESFQHGPGGKDIEIEILGDQIEQVQEVAALAAIKLNELKFVDDVKTNYEEGKKELKYTIKDLARNLNIPFDHLGAQIRNTFFGFEALRVLKYGKESKVMVQLPADERDSIAKLNQLTYRSLEGTYIPYEALLDIELSQGPATIQKTNGKVSIMITAVVDKEGDPKKIKEDFIQQSLTPLLKDHEGVFFSLEGQDAQSKESMGSLFMAYVLIAIPLIYFILAAIFKSYFQPMMIMFTIPFGIIGAVGGHLVLGYQLSLFSVIGIVALSGIVINDALVMMDFINRNYRGGMAIDQALVDSGIKRFRAIILTSLTTVSGLLPLLFETSVQAQVIIPMAVSISFGLIAATVLTLYFVPVLYRVSVDIARLLGLDTNHH